MAPFKDFRATSICLLAAKLVVGELRKVTKPSPFLHVNPTSVALPSCANIRLADTESLDKFQPVFSSGDGRSVVMDCVVSGAFKFATALTTICLFFLRGTKSDGPVMMFQSGMV